MAGEQNGVEPVDDRDQLLATPNPQCAEDILQMITDSVMREAQPPGHFLVGHTQSGEAQNVALAGGQRRPAAVLRLPERQGFAANLHPNQVTAAVEVAGQIVEDRLGCRAGGQHQPEVHVPDRW